MLSELLALRRAVFVDEQRVPAEIEQDAADGSAVHVVAIVDGRVVATGRLLAAGEVGVVGRMAVARPARRQGLGSAVLAELERQAAQHGLTAVELHAQRHAEGFYRISGYIAFGEPFIEAGIDHIAMRKQL